MLTVTDGKIIDGCIVVSLSSKIEHGPLKEVHALVMHQTGGENAQGTLASYKTSQYGAHFLIDKDGTIYQTARVTQKVFHIGKIRSRCVSLGSCSTTDEMAIKTILSSKVGYSKKVAEINAYESKKAYPLRYPTNEDSLGIEVAGKVVKGVYEDPTADQADSVTWLAAELLDLFKLTTADIYRHPQVSYKEESEAQNVKWQ